MLVSVFEILLEDSMYQTNVYSGNICKNGHEDHGLSKYEGLHTVQYCNAYHVTIHSSVEFSDSGYFG